MCQGEKMMVGGLGPGSPEKGSHARGEEGLMMRVAQAWEGEALSQGHSTGNGKRWQTLERSHKYNLQEAIKDDEDLSQKNHGERPDVNGLFHTRS